MQSTIATIAFAVHLVIADVYYVFDLKRGEMTMITSLSVDLYYYYYYYYSFSWMNSVTMVRIS